VRSPFRNSIPVPSRPYAAVVWCPCCAAARTNTSPEIQAYGSTGVLFAIVSRPRPVPPARRTGPLYRHSGQWGEG